MKKLASIAGGLALALAVALPAAAKKNNGGGSNLPEPRAFNVTFSGSYLLTQSSTVTSEEIKGVGIINSDDTGTLSGVEDFTLVNPSLTGGAGLACSGAVAGTIAQNSSGDGTYVATLNYTAASGAPAGCFASTTNLVCVRHVIRANLADDLAAGQYHCVATAASTTASGVTIGAVSETAHFGAHVVDAEDGD